VIGSEDIQEKSAYVFITLSTRPFEILLSTVITGIFDIEG
jgi:hypothetical protein